MQADGRSIFSWSSFDCRRSRSGGAGVPVDQLAIELSRQWLADNLRHLDVVRQVRIVPRIRPTSPELTATAFNSSRALQDTMPSRSPARSLMPLQPAAAGA